MRTLALVACSLIAGATIATAANGAAGWRVFAAGTDSSKYYSVANASADVTAPKALALRNIGKGITTLSWYLSCQSRDVTTIPGEVITIRVAAAKSCTVSGTVTSEGGGKVRIELLRR